MTASPSRRTPSTPQGDRRRHRRHIGRIVLVLFFAFPIVFMFVSSLKPDEQIFADLSSVRAFLPVGDLSFDNYQATFDKVPAGGSCSTRS